MDKLLNQLLQAGWLRAIDAQFGCFIAASETNIDTSVMAAWGAVLSREVGKGNVCLDISRFDGIGEQGKERESWLALLERLNLGKAEETLRSSSVVGNGDSGTPLVLDGTRLYLHRYWLAERQVAREIQLRTVALSPNEGTKDMLDSLFGAEISHVIPSSAQMNWQKVAAAVALTRKFSVISGGPGTGKTTTVAKLLAALVSEHQGLSPLDIKLVAPTGKAANRLTESLGKAISQLSIDEETHQLIPTQASTIHRLLGAIPNRVSFRHHAGNKLHLDVLVVDEASMVDLPLMASLLSALPEQARVILLGDRDQLASVEAGAVLGDICGFIEQGYSREQADSLSELTGYDISPGQSGSTVADCLCLLRKSYRFHAKSGIGQLAYAINAGDPVQVNRAWQQGFNDIRFHPLEGDALQALVLQAVNGYRSYLSMLKEGEAMEKVLAAFASVRVLCALTSGNFGVAGLNQAIEHKLSERSLIDKGDESWYHGRPIMVMQNDHGLGLYNGDIGIAVKDEQGTKVYFEMADGSVRGILASRLPEHQTAFAMTVHKSQGSEFDHTIFVCPPDLSPVLSRELIYTGVTRAKKQLDLYAKKSVLERGILKLTVRYSGLSDRLKVTDVANFSSTKVK